MVYLIVVLVVWAGLVWPAGEAGEAGGLLRAGEGWVALGSGGREIGVRSR